MVSFLTQKISTTASLKKNKAASLLGQRIAHPVFGEGVVIAIEGDGDNTRAQINFETEGTKWVVLSYANLKFM